jgi:hypothetical protein
MSDQDPETIARLLRDIPQWRHAAIVRKMVTPIRLSVTDQGGNVLYQEKFQVDDQGKITHAVEQSSNQHFLPPLTLTLVGEDRQVWQPELQ